MVRELKILIWGVPFYVGSLTEILCTGPHRALCSLRCSAHHGNQEKKPEIRKDQKQYKYPRIIKDVFISKGQQNNPQISMVHSH